MAKTIQQVLNFTNADLEHNRSGKLSPQQVGRQQQLSQQTAVSHLVIGLAAMALGGGMYATSGASSVLWVFGALAIGGVFLFSAVRQFRQRPDFKALTVRVVSGNVRVERQTAKTTYKGTTRHTTGFLLHVNGKVFPCSSDAASVFRRGGSYRVYYIQPAHDVAAMVSAEPTSG